MSQFKCITQGSSVRPIASDWSRGAEDDRRCCHPHKRPIGFLLFLSLRIREGRVLINTYTRRISARGTNTTTTKFLSLPLFPRDDRIMCVHASDPLFPTDILAGTGSSRVTGTILSGSVWWREWGLL